MIVEIILLVFFVWLLILTRLILNYNKASLYLIASIIEIGKAAANTPKELVQLQKLSNKIQDQLK